MPRNNLSRRYNPELAERNDQWDRKFCALFWSPFEIDMPQVRTEDGRVEELPTSEDEESPCSDPQELNPEHISIQMESLNVVDVDTSEVDPLALVTISVSQSSSSSDGDDDNDADYGSTVLQLPFQCPECPKRFRLVQYLRAHSVVHSGERPFECDCGKSFRHRAALFHHRKRTGHQDWQNVSSAAAGAKCNVCGQLFRSSGFLARHTAVACAKYKAVVQRRREGADVGV